MIGPTQAHSGTKAELLREEAVDRAIRDIEQEHGTTAASCAWAGCTRRALTGKAICAAHSSGVRPELLSYGRGDLFRQAGGLYYE